MQYDATTQAIFDSWNAGPTTPVKTTDSDARYLQKIYDIYDPWIAATTDRQPWLVTCPSGTTVTLMIPLGAAVEIEEAGYQIVAAQPEQPS